VAAGAGARFGGPKQYEPLGDRRVLDWSVAAARAVADGIVLVVPPDRVDVPEKDVDVVVSGAATRAGSVRAGLAVVPTDAHVIVVHDAARPLASAALFTAVVSALADTEVDGAVPGVALPDTIKQVQGGRVLKTLDRAELVAVQTPQAFRAAALRAAHASCGEATDDAALVEAAGGRVVVVEGETANAKVTTAADLASVRRFVAP
jgi:2-C-methyl-D-erythritol 4-phosphate cytidylyltransferase